MNSVELVKAICKERKIAISRLEKDLSFSNGYIGQLRKGTFPADRLSAIAKYLGVTTESLLGEEKPPTPEGERTIRKEDLQAAFWGGEKDLSQEDMDAMWSDVENFAAFVAQKRRQERNGST